MNREIPSLTKDILLLAVGVILITLLILSSYTYTNEYHTRLR